MTRRVLGVAALLIAATLAIVGTFLPLYEQVFDFGETLPMKLEQSSWGVRRENGQEVLGGKTLFGVPMVVGALLVVLGALRAGARWGRLAALVGSVLLLGSTWAVAQLVFALWSTKSDGAVLAIHVTIGLGIVVLSVASVVAVVGAFLVQEWPPRAPRPEGPVVYQLDGNDDDTPPFGIPVAELPVSSYVDTGTRPADTGTRPTETVTRPAGAGPEAGEPGGRTGP
ncbi:hypothetical protein [Actinosynnema sp. NPDC023587]|uniref:hypothetical protein n=1 Tax=Actinosynnema sp. NPDC023587 TaxID=3154695 RepID=UPI0033DC2554